MSFALARVPGFPFSDLYCRDHGAPQLFNPFLWFIVSNDGTKSFSGIRRGPGSGVLHGIMDRSFAFRLKRFRKVMSFRIGLMFISSCFACVKAAGAFWRPAGVSAVIAALVSSAPGCLFLCARPPRLRIERAALYWL